MSLRQKWGIDLLAMDNIKLYQDGYVVILLSTEVIFIHRLLNV